MVGRRTFLNSVSHLGKTWEGEGKEGDEPRSKKGGRPLCRSLGQLTGRGEIVLRIGQEDLRVPRQKDGETLAELRRTKERSPDQA